MKLFQPRANHTCHHHSDSFPARPGNTRAVVIRRAAYRAVAGLLFGSLVGCSLMHHHKQVDAALLDDKVTTRRVEAALKPNPDLRQVTVSTRGGEVVLRGHVRDEAARQRAARLAHTVRRVSKLDNEIQVGH